MDQDDHWGLIRFGVEPGGEGNVEESRAVRRADLLRGEGARDWEGGWCDRVIWGMVAEWLTSFCIDPCKVW